MAIPIINGWRNYYPIAHEGLGSSYERIIINKLLLKLYKSYGYHSALESPCFGFTGISGINLVPLAQAGCEVNLEDHDPERIEMIKASWKKLKLNMEIRCNPGYRSLDYPDQALDFAFNFSAMWFVEDLSAFIAELCRVTREHILICVPNRSGIGYKGQLKGYSPDLYPQLRPNHIDPQSIIWYMQKAGWSLWKQDYIDCPPWPDIGMNKEDYLRSLRGRKSNNDHTGIAAEKALSIMPYYLGQDPGFAARMLRFQALELLAPRCFKHIWAHHRYMLFAK